MEKRKFLKNEFDERVISSKEEFDEFLTFRKENDVWKQVFLKDVYVLGIPYEPLFQQGNEMEVEVIKDNILTRHILPLNKENTYCIREGLGIFLMVPVAKIPPTPVSSFGYNTVLQRAGISGPVMSNFIDTSKKMALSQRKKQDILNDCFSLNTYESSTYGWMLFRDGHISAFHSYGYGILNCWELCQALEDEIKKEHLEFFFKEATVNEEFLSVHYKINDPIINDRLLNIFNGFGMNIMSVELGLGLSISDVAFVNVSVYPIIYLDGKEIRLNNVVSVRHSSCNTIDTFIKKIWNIRRLFDECEDQIKELGNTKIENIAAVVNIICAENPALFSDEYIVNTRQELRINYSNEGTAMDVYLALYNTVERYITDKKPSMAKRLTLLEQVSEFLFFDYNQYERGWID